MPAPVVRLALFVVTALGVVLAVVGLLRLSLAAMAAGVALWLLGGYLRECLGGGYWP